MKCSDKLWLLLSIFAALGGSILQSGCDRMITPRNAQITKDADAKAAQGDLLRAISLYEAALDDSPKCADIHYKLALLYDDKMNDPLNAVHHFKRYLTLSPSGPHASDAKNFMKRDEVALLTNLSGDSVVSRTEAARLRNENLNLRKEIEDRSLNARQSAGAGCASPQSDRDQKRRSNLRREERGHARVDLAQVLQNFRPLETDSQSEQGQDR